MKAKKFLIVAIMFSTFCISLLGQTKTYPFEVKIKGHGDKAIFFIPGFASSSDVFDETVSVLEKNYTCYLLTMAGFAGVKPYPNPSYQNWVNAVADYIKDKNIHKPLLIGHSLGGVMALSLAAEYPDLLAGMINIDGTPAELSATKFLESEATKNTDCASMVKYITSMSDEQFADYSKESLKPYFIEDEQSINAMVEMFKKVDRLTFAQLGCELQNLDLRPELKKISCPSLILLNAEIKDKYKSEAEKQFEDLKTADIRFATKGQHMIMWQDKDWYLEQVNDFLGKLNK